MFKNAIIYTVPTPPGFELVQLEAALQRYVFAPCGATQEHSAGFVPPLGAENGALVECVGNQLVMRWCYETKTVPASALAAAVQAKADAIDREYGRKPGKKEKRDLEDEARLDLLPQAYPKRGGMWLWWCREAQWLVLDTSSQARADVVVSVLVELVKGLGLGLLDTQTSPQAAMAHWLLTQEAPAGFSIDRECELKAADESRAVVRYGRHPLDIAEVRQHVQQGKLPTKLAMTWDDRVSFVLDERLHLRKIEFLDAVLDAAGDEGGFDTDVAIFTGEMCRLIPDLIEALGGTGRRADGGAAQGAAVTGPADAPVDEQPEAAPF